MKKLVLAASCTLMALAAWAQNNILVSYTDSRPMYSGNDTVRSFDMLLLVNGAKSQWFNRQSQWADSLTASPDGEKKMLELVKASAMTVNPDGSLHFDMRKAPTKRIWTYVYTDLSKPEMTCYNKWSGKGICYTDSAANINWTVGEETKSILGYECVKAEADYHGRHWTVWFAPDISVPFGPWKLNGLPGMILEASANGNFSFKATGIEHTNQDIVPIYQPESYDKVERLKGLAENEYYINNLEKILSANANGKVTVTTSDGSSLPKFVREKHAIECDY